MHDRRSFVILFYYSRKARITTYEVSVVTGDVRGAGTNANVYITMYGEEVDTGKLLAE